MATKRARTVLLRPHDPASTRFQFEPSTRAPFAIRWYGATSLYGHFRNFIARVIAAEAVDSRDWMRPAGPDELLERAASVLRAGERGTSLVERLQRPLWIDFIADTGDDRDTSHAVGRMLAAPYRVRDADGTVRELPRGEILLFGGDTAYPVATADELHRRLTAPWNSAFRERIRRRRRRLLLGIPGNHDWYDGLDGFARFFRHSATGVSSAQRRRHTKRAPLLSRIGNLSPLQDARGTAGAIAHKLHLDEVSGTLRIFGSIARSVRAFWSGRGKKRRRRLVLLGYTAVQEASYFAMPLAPGVDLWGVDRQLGRLDFRQRTFFRKLRARTPHHRIVLVASDPFSAYGEPNQPGVDILESLGLHRDRDRFLYLTGDFHHYERRNFGASVQVIAGGGGAFLHGTRIDTSKVSPPEATYPSAEVSRTLLAPVARKLAGGRAGYLVHMFAALLAVLAERAFDRGATALLLNSAVMVAVVTAFLWLVAGHNKAHPRSVAAVALPFGVLLGSLPGLLAWLIVPAMERHGASVLGEVSAVVANAFVSTYVFGVFLTTVARLGLEHQQAFTVLGHNGFKHFVRLCVHPDGRIEAFTIGKDDPLADADPRLIDRFEHDLSALPGEEEPPASSVAPATLRPSVRVALRSSD